MTKLSKKQKFVRRAFRGCADMWNMMHERCPFFEEDPPRPAKEVVWKAKVEQGVVCPYFDIWMRCCMRFAMDHNGAMPVSECFPCLAVCTEDLNFRWDYETSPAEIEKSSFETVAVIGENSPFEWTVSGPGFSLANEVTDGLTNTLFADGSACGPATITVIGCDGREIIGYVRCTTGVWVSIGAVDKLHGRPAIYFGGNTWQYTEGKYRQTEKTTNLIQTQDHHCGGIDVPGKCSDAGRLPFGLELDYSVIGPDWIKCDNHCYTTRSCISGLCTGGGHAACQACQHVGNCAEGYCACDAGWICVWSRNTEEWQCEGKNQ